ncbi:aspartate aminotransferase family protein [Candidatus Margulisiibacteriota bacterium]
MIKKESLISRAEKVLSPVLAHYSNLEVSKGKGCYLISIDGKKFLDFSSGICVTNVGHCHPKVVSAAMKQAENLIHACAGVAYYEPNIALAEKLKSICPGNLNMSFFCQSGSEAVEAAIKLAKFVTKKQGILAFKGSFHGRTLGALSITGSKAKYSDPYKPLLPNVYFATYPYPYRDEEDEKKCNSKCLKEVESQIEKAGKDNMAAVIIEPVLGEGGYVVPPKDFLKGLQDICNKNEILLIFDEIQSGFGRTGKMFALEHFDVTPDIMTMSKAIASGFPLGAVIAKEELMKAWKPGAHGGTLSGNPVSCAAALASIDIIEKEKLASQATKQGNYLKEKLEKLAGKYEAMGDVRGLGLMIGVEFVKDKKSKEPNPEIVKKIMANALHRGLVLISCGMNDQVIRFIPPLIITKEQIDTALNIFEESVKASL